MNLPIIWRQTVDPRGLDGTSEGAEFSPDGGFIAAGGGDGKLRYFTSSGQKIWEADFNNGGRDKLGEVESVHFSPDGRLIAAGGNVGGVKIYQAGDGQIIKSLPGSEVDGLGWSPDGQTLAVANRGAINVYNTATWTKRYSIKTTGSTNSIDFSEDGQVVVTAGSDRYVRITRVSDGSLINSFIATDSSKASIKSVRISPDGNLIATANGQDKTIKVFRFDGTLVATLSTPSNFYMREAVAWSPDGKWLATGGVDVRYSPSTLRIYRTSDWTLAYDAPGHLRSIEYIDFADDGTILTSSEDGTIIRWESPSSSFPAPTPSPLPTPDPVPSPSPVLNPNSLSAQKVVVEAENIQGLVGFRKESRIQGASGGAAISLVNKTSNDRGTATFDFTGVEGRYNIVVGYFDETDGISSVSLKVGDKEVSSWNLDKSLGVNGPTAQTHTSQLISNVGLAPGDPIQLSGLKDKGEYLRIDNFSFVPVG